MGPFHLAFSLQELKRTQEAYDVVKPVITKFHDHQMMHYHLACYACRLGQLKEAYDLVENQRTSIEHRIRLLEYNSQT